MSSGRREMVLNTRERAISPDINRLQKFAGRDDAELLRYMLNVTGNDDLDAGGVITEYSVVEAPLRAEIINGLLVKPQAGSTDIFVDAGVLMGLAPDSGADESDYKYIHDAGTTTPGSLPLLANASGSIRIDVIECSINPSELIVTDGRDIFNPVTGLFAASVVTKERSGHLLFRVRQGIAGSGYPAAASGWLPLCVASVPAGSTNNDTVTFWDVRPLLSDREFQPFGLKRDLPVYRNVEINAHAQTNTTSSYNGLINGSIDIGYGGRRLGGRLRRGSPGTDLDSLDYTDASNAMPGNAFGTLWHLYLCTPFGLPRWARYTAGPSGRVPRSPRGIPVYSSVAPNNKGIASTVIPMPTLTGLVGSAAVGESVLAISGRHDGGVSKGAIAHGLFVQTPKDNVSSDITGTISGAYVFYFDLIDGVYYPSNAKAVLVTVRALWSVAETSTVFMSFNYPNLAGFSPDNNIYGVQFVGEVYGATVFEYSAWVPLPTMYPAGASVHRQINFTMSDMVNDPDSATLGIIGWQY